MWTPVVLGRPPDDCSSGRGRSQGGPSHRLPQNSSCSSPQSRLTTPSIGSIHPCFRPVGGAVLDLKRSFGTPLTFRSLSPRGGLRDWPSRYGRQPRLGFCFVSM